MPSAAMNTKIMSTAARGLTAVTSETRFAVRATMRQASASSGAISLRSASRTRSAPSMISVRWVSSSRRSRASCGAPDTTPVSSRTTPRASSRLSADDRGFGAEAQHLDRAQAQQRRNLAHRDDQEREKRDPRRGRAERAEPDRAGIKVLDQRRDGEAGAERGQRRRSPTRTRCPTESAGAAVAPPVRPAPAGRSFPARA